MIKKSPSFKFVATAILFIAFLQPTFAQEKINLKEKISQRSNVIKATLPNGLTYYIQKNAKPENNVELRLVIKAGSILEDEDQLGLAHFTEHMAFNGSKHFKKNELVSFLESIGVKFGADLNASTGFDQTIYMIPVPTSEPENLEKAFLVLSDWASGLTFDHAEIDKERGVVLEESRLRKGAAGRMFKVILPKMLAGSLYADRLPIGTDESLKTFKYEAVKRFYQDWYRPNLMAVMVVGDVDPAQAEALIKKNFGHLKNPKNERKIKETLISSLKTNDSLIVTDPEATSSSVAIYKGRQLVKYTGTYGDYRQGLVKDFFNSMMRSRMAELTQVAQPPFLGASSGVGALVGNYQQLSSSAVIGKAGVQAAIDALMQEQKKAGEFGFTALELDRVKTNALKSMEVSYKERDKQFSSTIVNELIRNFTQNETLPSLEAEFQFHQILVAGISLAEVNQYAKAILINDQAQLAIYQGPEKAEHATPEQAQLLTMVQEASKKQVTAHTEKKLAASFMAQRPSSGSIVSESSDKKLGTKTLTLNNGVKVVLKKTDFQNDQISIRAIRHGGNAFISDADLENARQTARLINITGLHEFSPSDMKKMLTGKTSNASVIMSEYSEGFSGSSNNADFETTLQLIYLSATAPRKDDVLFSSFINKSKDSIKNILSNPELVFSFEAIKASFPEHPRRPELPTEAMLDQLNHDRILALYKERFSSLKNHTFFVVGNFEEETIKPLLANYLGSLPTTDLELGLKDSGLRPVRGIVKKDVFAGKEKKSIVNLNFTGEQPYSKPAALKMGAMIAVMQLRMTEAMREELGAVYSPRVSGGLNRVPYHAYNVSLNMPCAPENVEKLIASSFDVIAKMKANPPTEEELNKVKTNWIKNYRQNLKNDAYWMTQLMNSDLFGEDPMEIYEQEKRYNAVTTQDVQDAAKLYLDTKNYIQVVLYPEKKL